MGSVLVSLRIPRSLKEELQRLAKVNYFMDLSDEVKYILRQKKIETEEKQKMLIDINENQATDANRRLIQDIRKLLDSYKND